MNIPKVHCLLLLRLVFKATILIDDLDVVTIAKPGVGIPWSDDIDKMFRLEVAVERQPFLLNMGDGLARHKRWAMVGYNFLCRQLGLIEV